MVLFPLDQVPEMARGRGVRLQKYSSAKLSDVAVFELKAGRPGRIPPAASRA